MQRVLYHCTTQTAWEGIQRDGEIKPNAEGQIWFCDASALNATIQWLFARKKFVSILIATETDETIEAIPWMLVPGVYIVEKPVTKYYFISQLQIPPTFRGRVRAFDRWEC